MRRADDADVPRIKSFLLAHAATSMFPLSNLARHGTSGDHPRVVSFWIKETGGAITDVLTVSQEGLVFPQLRTVSFDACVPLLREIHPKGFLGDAGQVMGLRAALGLCEDPGLDMHEPHYHLDLKEMVMPETANRELVPLGHIPRTTAEAWRRDFCIEALQYPSDAAAKKAEAEVKTFVANDTHRALLDQGEPVGMTGFNAVLPDIVQVGGVYTPPTHRGLGFARIAVALHLAEARAAGVTQAFLSAATPAAARAYEAIGFRQIGEFCVCIWPERLQLNG